MDHIHHGIDYIEFYVTDMKVSQEFYGKAFGWEFTEYSPDYSGIAKPGGGEYGGLCTVDKINTGGPLVVLYSKELEDSFMQVKEAGGKITKEIFEFPGGKRFQFLDPSGNELAVWSEN